MNLEELAKAAKVSVATVSKAFREADDISRETKDRIFSIAKEYGCFGKYYKGKLQKRIIAIICPEIESEYYTHFVQELQNVIEQRDGIALIAQSHFSGRKMDELLEYLSALGRVDGIIAFGLSTLKKGYNIPIVSVGGTSKASMVRIDFSEAIDETIQYLKDLGHRRIAFIGDPLTTLRLNQFKDSMRRCGLMVEKNNIIIANQRFENAGVSGVEILLERNCDCTALFCAYDYIAIGAIHRLELAGKRVPEDYSVVGMDNIGTSSYLSSSLTTVDSHISEACETIVELIYKKLDNPLFTVRSQVVFSANLIIRDSTGKVNPSRSCRHT